jgi:Rpb7p/Rpc25p/MJ0397 family SHS2 domain-containing protein
MFILSILKVSTLPTSRTCHSQLFLVQQDKIPIHPSQFGLPPEQALINELNKKYANRVLHDVGLCICVFDLAEVGEGKVRYGDGFLWYTGKFKVLDGSYCITSVCLTLLIQCHSCL